MMRIVLLVAIFFGCVNSTVVTYQGHVYCRVRRNWANGTTDVLPARNMDMRLMEEDVGYIIDPDDELGTCKTEADGSFHLTGEESEINGLEPYLVVKSCRTDDPSICNEKKYAFRDKKYRPILEEENANVYVDNDFCQHICNDGVCQSG